MNKKQIQFISIVTKWIEEAEERKEKALLDEKWGYALEQESYSAGLMQALSLFESMFDKGDEDD